MVDGRGTVPLSAPSIPDHQLLRLIGRGSYGEVWLARNALSTPRAVKIVRRQSFSSHRPYEREFVGIQHFEPISRRHEGFLDVLQVGRNDQEGFFYYVMELADRLDGADIDAPGAEVGYEPKTLERVIRGRGRLPVAECVDLYWALADALSFLHAHHLVHRDVKPANIVYVRGRAMIADIGLVVEIGEAGSFVGTEGFIPPDGPGTAGADLFALGKVIYEAMTGLDRMQFPSLPPDLLEGSAGTALLELNAILGRSCAPAADERYATAAPLLDDLQLLRTGRSVLGLRSLERRLRRARRWAVGGAAVTLLALMGWGGARHQATRERTLRNRAERAEEQSRQELGWARLQEARAIIQTVDPDRRLRALEALRTAVGRVPELQLRNALVSALAMPAAPAQRLWTNAAPGDPSIAFFDGVDRYLEDGGQGGVVIRRLADGALDETVQFPAGVRPRMFYQTARGHWRYVLDSGRLTAWSRTNTFCSFTLALRGGEAFEFEPSEERLGHWRQDGSFRIVRLPSLQIERELRLARKPGDFRFSPAGKQLVLFGGTETRVELVDAMTGEVRASIDPDVEQEFCVWSPDSRRVAFSTADNRVAVWEIGSRRMLATLSGHQSRITDLQFFPDSDGLVTASWDSTTRFWEARSGRELLRVNDSGAGLTIDPGTRRFGSSQHLGRLTVRQLQLSPIVQTFRQPFSCVDIAFAPDESAFAAVGDQFRVLRLSDGQELLRGDCPGTYRGWFSADGREFWTSERTQIVRRRLQPGIDRWSELERIGEQRMNSTGKHPADVSEGRIAWLDGPFIGTHGGETPRWRHEQEGVETIAISRDGRWVATGTRNHHGVRVWHFESGQPAWTNELRWGSQVAFSPASDSLAGTGTEETVVWDLRTGATRWRLPASPGQRGHWHLNYSPDGRLLAVARTPYLVQLLNASNGTEVVSLAHPFPEYISEVRFSPAGRYVAVVCESGAIQVWDLRAIETEWSKLGLHWPG